MQLRSGVQLALRQIREQKLKSAFSVLGVVIGVMFLVAVVSVVEGMNRYMHEDFAGRVYGLNTVTVRRAPAVRVNPTASQRREWNRRPRLRIEDAEAIRRQLSVPAVVATAKHTGGTAESPDGTRVENVRVTAATADYFRIREYALDRGRLFGSAEDRAGAPVIVLGHDTAEQLFGHLDPIGRHVRVLGEKYTVVGVLSREGTLFGMSLDSRAIAPHGSAMGRSIAAPAELSEIIIRAESPAGLARAIIDAEAAMRVQHRLRPGESNTFEIETADESLAFWDRISQILYIAFPGLVGIALVVGGMVIMNIMLMSVAERTREIGMRKAVGARRRDIVVQVLIESGTLSGVGAAAGIGIGVGLAQLVNAVSPLPASIAPHWIAGAALLGVGVGVVAGLYPAARAAALDPVVALRQE